MYDTSNFRAVEPSGRSKADTAIRVTLTVALRRRDFRLVGEALMRYGRYLELVEGGDNLTAVAAQSNQ